MSGWKEDTIIHALTCMNQSMEEAEEIYRVSGCRIRLAVWGMQAGRMDRIKRWYDELVHSLGGQEHVVLATTKTDNSASASNSDWGRTRFLNYDDKGTSLLIVDSFYAMTKLTENLDSLKFISSYDLAEACGLNSARGWYFEEIKHLWFKDNLPKPVIEVWVRSQGSGAEGMQAFDSRKKYWIPATSNFANMIDAAFICGSVLVCLQYTLRTEHSFNRESFWNDFAGSQQASVHLCRYLVCLSG